MELINSFSKDTKGKGILAMVSSNKKRERILVMNKKQTIILITTIVFAVLLGSGVGFLYANQTNPRLEKAALEQEMQEQLTQEAQELSK